MGDPWRRAPLWVAGAIAFTLLATANGAGYRYGASDQALYVPAIEKAINPAAFPRDAALIDAQAHFMLIDKILGALVRASGLSIELLSLIGYLVSLALMWAAGVLIGQRAYSTPTATIAFAAALTLRHQISRTSANSFEPYFNPRMLAFGVGMLAVAAVLRRRPLTAVACVAICALAHITTGLWFAVLVGVALAVANPAWRRWIAVAGSLGVLAGVWALLSGPMRERMVAMDARWLEAVASKDTLFATDWPLWAWATNLGLFGVLWWAHAARRRRGQASLEETGLAWGATALVAIFLLTLPAVALRLAMAVQLQISRVFWLVDFIALLFVIGALVDVPRTQRRVAVALAGVLVAFSAVRGAYIMFVERSERPLFAVRIAESPWEDAMTWLRQQPLESGVLADPGHAWKYGASVRVSPGRDVYLEEVKDAALAMYSRDVATRVVERTQGLGSFAELTAEHARALGERYDLRYLVTEKDLTLPLAYRNTQFRIYDLRADRPVRLPGTTGN